MVEVAITMPKVRTRFAPSPTGNLHIGGVRTALFSWLYAQKHQGEFILRIEDTDTVRSTQASTDAILKNLSWLGICPTDSPIFQSQRLSRYRHIAQQLVQSGHAYYCDCDQQRLETLRANQKKQNLKPQYDRKCRERELCPNGNQNYVIRFKTPIDGEIIFEDAVYGAINVQNKELDDLIILRGDGSPTYNFAVVVDDIDNQISHIIRGDDHLSNTSRQIHLYRILNASIPQFAHCPMILGNDGKRLSKRHGATDIGTYREQGFLPIALLNYLVRLGWSHGDQEVFSLEEMMALFDLDAINRASPKFDLNKLLWVNAQQLKQVPNQQLTTAYQEQLTQLKIKHNTPINYRSIIALYCERYPTLAQIAEESAFLFQRPKWQSDDPLYQQYIQPNQHLLSDLKHTLNTIATENWQAASIQQMLKSMLKKHTLKMPQLGMPMRVALSGKSHTPDISQIATLLGKQEALLRLEVATTEPKKKSSP